jgi:hypothetical protein
VPAASRCGGEDVRIAIAKQRIGARYRGQRFGGCVHHHDLGALGHGGEPGAGIGQVTAYDDAGERSPTGVITHRPRIGLQAQFRNESFSRGQCGGWIGARRREQ